MKGRGFRQGLLVFGALSAAAAEGAPPATSDLVQVCTITLGSSDEKEAFRAELLPKERYQWIELGPLGGAVGGAGRGNGDDWFNRSCQYVQRQGIHCDLLLVSGHFGGDLFFGSRRGSGARLTMETLEAHACARTSCSGILSDPAQVFLFGCNTLAGKNADSRTRAQYIAALRADGIGLADAERIADARYGPFGESFRDRMGRIFAGSGEILGFDSVAPSGGRVRAPLRSYLRRVQRTGDGEKISYEERLLREDLRRFQGPLASGAVGDLGREFKTTLEASCLNADVLPLPGARGDPRAEGITRELCSLNDESGLYSERMERMARLMATPDATAYFPLMQRFFRQVSPTWDGSRFYYPDPSENTALSRLKGAKPAGFTRALALLPAGLTRFQLGFLGFQLGWIAGTAGLDELKVSLEKILGPQAPARTLDSDTVDYFCQVRRGLPAELRERLARARPELFRSGRERGRLQECLGL